MILWQTLVKSTTKVYRILQLESKKKCEQFYQRYFMKIKILLIGILFISNGFSMGMVNKFKEAFQKEKAYNCFLNQLENSYKELIDEEEIDFNEIKDEWKELFHLKMRIELSQEGKKKLENFLKSEFEREGQSFHRCIKKEINFYKYTHRKNAYLVQACYVDNPGYHDFSSALHMIINILKPAEILKEVLPHAFEEKHRTMN
jgi:hypothetical protein